MHRAGWLAVAMLLLAWPATALAQSWTVLVVGDSTDPSTMPEGSPVFEKAYQELAGKLSQKGITARRATEIPAVRKLGDRIGKDVDAALDAARKADRRVDAVLLLRVYVSMHRGPKHNSYQLWIDGDARELSLGRPVAEQKSRDRKRHEVERRCGRDCMLEAAEEKIGELAAAFGDAMAGRLAGTLSR